MILTGTSPIKHLLNYVTSGPRGTNGFPKKIRRRGPAVLPAKENINICKYGYKYIYIHRLSERFAPVFYFNSELSLCLQNKTITKTILKYLFVDFQNFMKIEFWLRKIFEIFSFINLSWGHVRSQTTFGPNRFSRYWT